MALSELISRSQKMRHFNLCILEQEYPSEGAKNIKGFALSTRGTINKGAKIPNCFSVVFWLLKPQTKLERMLSM